jgi:hypothetical protein
VGGMSKLAKFYERFREVRIQLSDIGSIPGDFATLGAISPDFEKA